MDKLAEVRSLFEARLNKGVPNPPGEFDPRDLERVKSDKYVNRVLDHCDGDVKDAAKMLWEIMIWRKKEDIYNIGDKVNVDYLKAGIMFPHGRDVDGSLLFVFKWKLYVRGQRNVEELKRVIVYWVERMEREEDGKAISLFFDMEDCGVSNMDVDLIKFMIALLKNSYPLFVNYSIIYRMPWLMSAGFRLIRGLFPARALERFRFVDRDSLKELVRPEQALLCWGGTDPYVFQFVPSNPP